MPAERNKIDARWREGVRLGIKLGSGESVIGTKEGVAKARDFRSWRMVEDGVRKTWTRSWAFRGKRIHERREDMS